ncbi:IMP cyclohydrolase [Elusimicrobiota bacterium]
MSNNILPIKYALMSVYYKDGIVEMAKILQSCNIKILSSGGTAKKLKEAGIDTKDIAQYTTYPALFGHRVVTLHPKVHGGILYRRDNEQDVKEAAQHDILDIGLVVVNLYPVEEALSKNATMDQVVELTDIGGPTLIRAAAKNHKYVGVVADPADYLPVANEIKQKGGLTLDRRMELAGKVFEVTANYDNKLAQYYRGVHA